MPELFFLNSEQKKCKKISDIRSDVRSDIWHGIWRQIWHLTWHLTSDLTSDIRSDIRSDVRSVRFFVLSSLGLPKCYWDNYKHRPDAPWCPELKYAQHSDLVRLPEVSRDSKHSLRTWSSFEDNFEFFRWFSREFPANRTLFLRTLAHNQFIMMHKAWRLGDLPGAFHRRYPVTVRPRPNRTLLLCWV